MTYIRRQTWFTQTLGVAVALAILLPLLAMGDTTRVPTQGGGTTSLVLNTTPATGGTNGGVLFELSDITTTDADITFVTDLLTVTKLSTGGAPTAANAVSIQETAGCITFEGSSADANQGRLCQTNPAAGDQTYLLPNAIAGTQTIAVLEGNQSYIGGITIPDSSNFVMANISTIGGMSPRATLTPDSYFMFVGSLSNSFHIAETGDFGTDFNNGRCGTSACANPSLITHSSDAVTTEYLQTSVDTTGAAHVQSNLAEITVGGSKLNITEGSAQAIVRITLPTAGVYGAFVTYTVSDSDGTDHVGRTGTIQVQGANKAGTNVCTILGTRNQETEDGSEIVNAAGAFTLTYTWTNAVSTVNCDLSLNAASSAGVNTYDITWTVILNGNSSAITVTPL